MPTTVESVARDVVGAIATDAGYLLASRWVADRYRQVAAKTRLRHLRRVGEVIVPAELTAGTVTVTLYSRVVTPDATALAAWQVLKPPDQLAGRSLRVNVEWYEIASFDGTVASLVSPFAESGQDGSGLAYKIVPRVVTLAPDARWLGQTAIHMRRQQPVTVVALQELDIGEPNRVLTGQAGATMMASVGTRPTPDGALALAVEFYPYGLNPELYHYLYYTQAPMLPLDGVLPPAIDAHVLKEGAIADLYRYEMAKAIRAGDHVGAALWRNEFRAQETSWMHIIQDAFRADRDVDDVSFILSRAMTTAVPKEIMTARDDVLTRWPV